MFGKALDLDEKGRAAFAAALLPAMERTKEEGLVISQRPAPDPDGVWREPGETAWDQRYIETAVTYARAVESLMPPEDLQSVTWKMFAEGEFASILLMIGAEDSPFGGMLRASPEQDQPPVAPGAEPSASQTP